MKKSRIPILLLLMLMLVIVPAQNNSVPQENEQKLGTQLPRLMGTTVTKTSDNREHEDQSVSSQSDFIKENKQDTTIQNSPKSSESQPKKPSLSTKGITAYQKRGPIEILYDSAFDLYFFPGNGSSSNPYIIDGYNITGYTANLIHIEDTTMYFNVTNCYLNSSNSGYHCIWMKNVTFGTIADNTICNTTQAKYGIGMHDSLNNTLLNNTILGCDSGIWMDGSHNNSLLNNTVEGLWEGLYVNRSNDNVFTSNTIYNSFSAGIYLDYNNTWNTFTNNTIYDTACYGISTSGGCDNNTFAGNTIYNCGINGFEVFDSRNNTLLGNTIYGCFEGISLDSANYNSLSGNTVYDCVTGISLSSSSKNTLTGNTIHDIFGASTGISLSNSHNNTLASNIIFNVKYASGISLFSSNDNTLSSNTIYNITNSNGISLSSSNDNTLSSNTIYNITIMIVNGGNGFFSFSGISLSSSSNNTVDSNTIYNCEYWGFGLTSSSNNNTLQSNTLYNCSTGIHLGQSNNNTFVNNIVYDCVTGMSLDSSNNNTFTGNTFHDILGGATGISLSSSNYNTLSGNTIYNIDFGDGIDLYSSSYNILTNNTIYNAPTSEGIYTSSSHNNTFSSNTIYDCNYGIYLYDSSNNTVCYNIVYDNTYFGLYISSSLLEAENNTVTWNNFVNNYPIGSSQAYDSETDNVIMYNYWDNHISPDSDLDGFLDDPYIVYNDTANNEDPYPRAHPWMYHAPLTITENADFATLGFPGNGTQANPYLITNYYFVHSSDTLIHIEDTTVYFHITNNILKGFGGSNDGIYMKSVTHGTIENNIVCDLRDGIYLLLSSDNNTLMSNVIFNCGRGIDLSSSHNNTINNNTIHDSSYDSNIMVYSSNSNEILNNILFDALRGITLESSSQFNNLSGNTIFNLTHFAGADSGIYVLLSNNNSLTSNTIYNCSYDGIKLEESNYNFILGNTIYNNSRYGIYFTSSNDDNTIKYNVIYNNTDYGLYLEGATDTNIVNWNNFMNNSDGFPLNAQAYDDFSGSNNNISYNYWNEWISPDETPPNGIVDNPYAVDGLANNNDSYPLTTPVPPPVIIIKPLAKDYSINTIIVQLTGYARYYWYSIDDGQNQTWITSMTETLLDGTYTIHAYGNDTLGTIAHVSVTFTIDTTPPTVEISSPENITYTFTDVPLFYTVTDGPFTTTIYVNGFANTSAIPYGSVLSDFPDVPAIPDGSYNITIVAVDQVGNIGKATVFLTLDTTPPTITIVSPIDKTYTTSTITVELSGDAEYYWYYIAGVDSNNQTWIPGTTRILDEGEYTLYAFGNDSVGNIGYAKVEFIIDTTLPTTSTTTPTTATQETTPESSTTTTTATSEAASGSFPGVFTLFLFLVTLVVVIRRHKKK